MAPGSSKASQKSELSLFIKTDQREEEDHQCRLSRRRNRHVSLVAGGFRDAHLKDRLTHRYIVWPVVQEEATSMQPEAREKCPLTRHH